MEGPSLVWEYLSSAVKTNAVFLKYRSFLNLAVLARGVDQAFWLVNALASSSKWKELEDCLTPQLHRQVMARVQSASGEVESVAMDVDGVNIVSLSFDTDTSSVARDKKSLFLRVIYRFTGSLKLTKKDSLTEVVSFQSARKDFVDIEMNEAKKEDKENKESSVLRLSESSSPNVLFDDVFDDGKTPRYSLWTFEAEIGQDKLHWKLVDMK